MTPLYFDVHVPAVIASQEHAAMELKDHGLRARNITQTPNHRAGHPLHGGGGVLVARRTSSQG